MRGMGGGIAERTLSSLLALGCLCGCGGPGAQSSRSASPPPSTPAATPSASPSADVPSPPSATGCGGAAPAAVDAPIELQVVEFLNAERRQNGLSELQASTDLADAARLHARDLAADDYLEHDSYDRSGGRLVKSCGWSQRVLRFVPGTRQLAENIASGAETPRDVVDGWMGSSVHRRNVLGPAYTRVGVGYWAGGRGGFYWVADFAGD
jgi:uncharacterized protein YkwD